MPVRHLRSTAHLPSPHPPAPKSSEYAEQCALFDFLRMNKGLHPEYEFIFAVPNGAKLSYRKNKFGSRYSPEAIRLLKSGMLPGVSDIVIPLMRGGFGGMFLELKYGKNTATEEQHKFLDAMQSYGYYAIIAYGADEAIKQIEDYVSGKIIKPPLRN